ncbi:hypothetical protein M422DRAFT_275579 [Sphaerobolus stellatus SS14]|uniref:CCHC-type domain-containing protein n=1 Tax=Sphaerobolus stellatus (strain SS14) TaxID=990650 RepID=A0A0C9UEY9_SPHS4|nr:hypothetical protein M422DRAFT_275579 [Sphaerobolus stellatus SS14]
MRIIHEEINPNNTGNFNQKDDLHAKGLCFICKEKNHLVRDCPSKKYVSPLTQIRLAAIDIEKVAENIDQQMLGSHMLELFNIDFLGICSKGDCKRNLKKVWERLIPALLEAVPFKTDFFGVPEYDPYEWKQFKIDKFDDAHLILYDWHTGDDHLLDTGLLMQSTNNIIEHIRLEKLRMSSEGTLINELQAVRALERTKENIFGICSSSTLELSCAAAELESVSDEQNDSLASISSKNSNSDTLAVFQEVYDDIANILGELVHFGDCVLQSPCLLQQHFTIVPTQFNRISIADHVLNIVHTVSSDQFFNPNFNVAEFITNEIRNRVDDIPLTALYTGDSEYGLWENDWIIDPWDEIDNDDVILAHNQRVDELIENETIIQLRFPAIEHYHCISPNSPECLTFSTRGESNQQEGVKSHSSSHSVLDLKSLSSSEESLPALEHIELLAVEESQQNNTHQVGSKIHHISGLQQNSASPKDFKRPIPRSIIVQVLIQGHKFRALLDSGSLSDFIGSKVIDLLCLTVHHLAKPITCQLAASGSCTQITGTTNALLKYQDMNEI